MRLDRWLLPVLGVVAVLGLASVTHAAAYQSPLLTISVDVEGDGLEPIAYSYAGDPVDGYAGTRYRYLGGTTPTTNACFDTAASPVPCYDIDWDLDIIVDPIISGPVAVTNPSGATQTYDVTFTLPATAFAGPTNIGGSIAATVVDGNFGSATIATSGASMYRALIDGAVVRTLLDAPSSATQPTPISLPGTIASNFGIEVIPTGMTSDIGIRYRFSLTAGDSATINGNFLAEPVPEPGTLGLAAAGIALLAVARRRASIR